MTNQSRSNRAPHSEQQHNLKDLTISVNKKTKALLEYSRQEKAIKQETIEELRKETERALAEARATSAHAILKSYLQESERTLELINQYEANRKLHRKALELAYRALNDMNKEFNKQFEQYLNGSDIIQEPSTFIMNGEKAGARMEMGTTRNDNQSKKVFISYSWDDSEHKKWVRQLASDLCTEDGIATIIDIRDLKLGDPIPQFMEHSIKNSDYVIIVYTPKYKEKADKRTGGVGYEENIITGEIYSKNNHRKFIPVLARGSWNDSTPTWALGKFGVDMTTKEKYSEGIEKLKNAILSKE